MLIKLTYYGSGSTTLVNTDQIETIYSLFDKTQGRYSTKITFGNNSYINVEESIADIMKIQEDLLNGIYQPKEVTLPEMNLQNRFEDSYNQPRKTFRKRTYEQY